MHHCPIANGDFWLQNNVDDYVQWARVHNSLLILTCDEDDNVTQANQIPMVFTGANVKLGHTSANTVTHYDVLRTIGDMYGLSSLGNAVNAATIDDVWVDDRFFVNGFE